MEIRDSLHSLFNDTFTICFPAFKFRKKKTDAHSIYVYINPRGLRVNHHDQRTKHSPPIFI